MDGEKFTILVVEDNSMISKLLVDILERRNSDDSIVTAESAEQAIERLSEYHFDLVLTDVSLPKMNGIDLVAKIFQVNPNLPCMMVSGYSDKYMVQRSLEVGARGYVAKENVDELTEGIRSILQGKIFLSSKLVIRMGKAS